MLGKKYISTLAISFITVSLLAGCGGREAKTINITNPTDSMMDCAGIAREFGANERQIIATMRERNNGRGKNVALGITGVVFFPAWFFMDPKSPEAVEINALRNRNEVLEQMSKTKKCPALQSQLRDAYKKIDANKVK